MSFNGKYKTSTPACNRLLQQKWDGMRYQSHKARLSKIKATVDTSKPKEGFHIKQKAKKLEIESERLNTIDRHNRQLLGKMEVIMQSRGRVDHINHEYQPKPSLHHFARKVDADRIHRDNLSMLKRLQSVRPLYKTDEWEADFRKHQYKMQALSTFPPVSNRAWQSRHLSRRRTRQEDKEEEEYEEVNIEELSTVEDEEEKFVLPPIVEEKRVPTQLSQSLKAAKEKERSKPEEEIIEIMN